MTARLTLTSRHATEEDLPWLWRLFAVTAGEEFASVPLPPAQREDLLRMQFRARETGYAAAYPGARNTVLCVGEDVPAGRVLVHETADALRLVDIAVLPEYRGQRIATSAIHAVQAEAARKGLPVRLSVRPGNRARRLYDRQGFVTGEQNETACAMEWRALPESAGVSRALLLDRIVRFLEGVGLSVELAAVPRNTFLPGIELVSGGLRVDCDRLLYPGDLLHEAGHLAVMLPAQRHAAFPEPAEDGEEIAATAWSYAAALAAAVPVDQVLHDNGYRGSASALRAAFQSGTGFGVPLLAWMGLSRECVPANAGSACFPHMLRWLREDGEAGAPAGQKEQDVVAA